MLLKKDFWEKGTMSYCIALLTMIVLPVYHWYLPPFMILWFIARVIEIRLRTDEIKSIPGNYKILFSIFVLFYLWQIVGMTYSDNPHGGWRNIVLRISLFVFPLVLFSPGTMIQKHLKFLVRIFALSTLSFFFFCVVYAFYRSITFNGGFIQFNPHPSDADWLNYFFASEFSVFQHPSYLALYAILSFFIAAEALLDKTINIIRRVLWAFALICFLIFIYLLASRAELLTALITIPVYILLKFKIKSIKRIIGLASILALVVFFVLIPILKSNPRFSYYFNEKSKGDLSSKVLEESRLTIWKSSLILISNNFVFGVGTGDIQDELNKEYNLIPGNNLAVQNNLNAHNQYLEIQLENGIIGLLLFLSIFGMMIYIAIKNRNTLYLIFVISVFISFMFETMLNRLGGVAFFSLFAFLLLNLKPAKKPDESISV